MALVVACHQLHRPGRSATPAAAGPNTNAWPLRPTSSLPAASTGNGNSDHIGDKVPLPPVIHLNDGVYEVGRTSPADIRIAVPTVSSRHALLRVGKGCVEGGQNCRGRTTAVLAAGPGPGSSWDATQQGLRPTTAQE